MTRPNVRPYNNKAALLFPPTVQEYLPKYHLARVVDALVEGFDLTDYYASLSTTGNPSYDPALMLKVWLYGYAMQVTSSRRLEAKLQTDVAFIFLAGMQKPDHKTLADFRRDYGIELAVAFTQIVHACDRLGMVKLGAVSLDSKVMKANAAASRTLTREKLQAKRDWYEAQARAYLDLVARNDEAEDKLYGPDKNGRELPEELHTEEGRRAAVKRVLAELAAAEATMNRDGIPKVNTTDPDARFQKDKGRIVPGYRAQAVVDDAEQIIIAGEVLKDQSDQTALLPMVDKTQERIAEIRAARPTVAESAPVILLADSGYSSGSNLDGLVDRSGIDPYLPEQKPKRKRTGQAESAPASAPAFADSQFVYESEADRYRCPEGQTLSYCLTIAPRRPGGSQSRLYRGDQCSGCAWRSQCSPGKKRRELRINEYADVMAAMRAKMATTEGKRIYARRKIVAEPALGDLSQNLGFRGFLLRGVEKAQGEFMLMCSAHNIRKLWRRLDRLKLSLQEALQLGVSQPGLNSS